MRKTNLVKIVAMVTVLTLTAGNTTVLAAEEPQLYYDENGEECYTTVEITEEEEAEETAYDETDFDYREYVEETEEFIPFEDGEIYEEEVEEESEDDELFDDTEEYVEENVKYVEEVDVVEVAANTKGYENEQKLFENNFGKEN